VTTPAVYGAINKVKLALARDGIAKGKTTQAQGRYQYRGVDDVMDACAMPMAEAGVCVFQRTISHRIEEHKSNANSTLFYCYVECEFDFVAAEDGSMHTARFVGESFDSGDKSTGKAETYAYRNCLIKTFVIPVNGAEADSDKHESPPVQHREQRREPPPQQRAQTSAPESAATKPLPTRTSKNYPVTQYAEVPFTSMPSSALTAYIQHYESRLPTLDNEHHRAAAKMSILAAQKELEARRQEEMKSGSASA
jgi:hypothetical protein